MLSRTSSHHSVHGVFRRGRIALGFAILWATFPLAVNAADALQLDDYHGKVVVLDFWASWCVPCRRSFPWMNRMHAKYAEDGVVVIAVNLDNDLDDAHAFLQQYSVDFVVAYDHDRSLAREYGVQVMPSSFVIGRDGKIAASHLGFKTAKTDEYEAAIVSALRSQNVGQSNE